MCDGWLTGRSKAAAEPAVVRPLDESCPATVGTTLVLLEPDVASGRGEFANDARVCHHSPNPEAAFTVHTKAFHDAGDSVVVEARYTGTYKPTGKSMDTQVCHVWDVKDGKVTRFQQYVDTAKLRDVMAAR